MEKTEYAQGNVRIQEVLEGWVWDKVGRRNVGM